MEHHHSLNAADLQAFISELRMLPYPEYEVIAIAIGEGLRAKIIGWQVLNRAGEAVQTYNSPAEAFAWIEQQGGKPIIRTAPDSGDPIVTVSCIGRRS